MSEITTCKSSRLPSTKQSVSEHYTTFTWLTRFLVSQQTQNLCITFVQCGTNVKDVGPTLCKCYIDVLCFLLSHTYYRVEMIHFKTRSRESSGNPSHAFADAPVLFDTIIKQGWSSTTLAAAVQQH